MEVAKRIIPDFPKIELQFVMNHISTKYNGKVSITTLYDEYKARNSAESKNLVVQSELTKFRKELGEIRASIL